MKSYREYFRNNFVKPLYRPKFKEICPSNFAVATHSVIKLDGSDVVIKRQVVSDKINKGRIKDITIKNKNRENSLIPKRLVNNYINTFKHDSKYNLMNNELIKNFTKCIDSKMLNSVQKNNVTEETEKVFDFNTIPDVWLRLYPLPKQPQESSFSLIFRCVFCIIGLYSVLILWTLIWVFVIYSFEGPYEIQISIDFEEDQNQLVIDLATELRLITPVSPKWKAAIIKRIEDERQLTIRAVARGAKLHPGEFWDLSGTFLFTVYVMTALGFGAPVPQTIWGRTSALVYALLAVPTHLYLMLNISTCIVTHIEACISNLTSKLSTRKSALENKSQSPNCSRHSDVEQAKYSSCFKSKIMRILNILCACRCMPLITICYYVCGALAFGWLRHKHPLEVVMFPLEFTTTGGLELVAGHVRILYGIYLEGAVTLLACFLSIIKRKSISAFNSMACNYRLFTSIDIK